VTRHLWVRTVVDTAADLLPSH